MLKHNMLPVGGSNQEEHEICCWHRAEFGLPFLVFLFNIVPTGGMNKLDAPSEDGSSAGIHQLANRLCRCLFVFVIVFRSSGCSSSSSFLPLAS